MGNKRNIPYINDTSIERILTMIWEKTNINIEQFIQLELKIRGYSTTRRRLFVPIQPDQDIYCEDDQEFVDQ